MAQTLAEALHRLSLDLVAVVASYAWLPQNVQPRQQWAIHFPLRRVHPRRGRSYSVAGFFSCAAAIAECGHIWHCDGHRLWIFSLATGTGQRLRGVDFMDRGLPGDLGVRWLPRMVLDAVHNELFVCNTAEGAIVVFDGATCERRRSISLPLQCGCGMPASVSIDASRQLLFVLSNHAPHTFITVFHARTGAFLWSMCLNVAPYTAVSIATMPSSELLFVLSIKKHEARIEVNSCLVLAGLFNGM